MKFKGKLDIGNASKDVRKILSHEMNSSIEDLKDNYGYDDDIINGLSYSLYVYHSDKSLHKGGKTRFVKTYEKSVNTLIEDGFATFEEMGMLLYMSTAFTSHEDNYLRIDDELVGKNDIIDYMVNNTNIGMSESALRRKFKGIEKKNYLIVDNHPDDYKKKIYYLTPLLFYKGRYMDNGARNALVSVYRGIYDELKELSDRGEVNIKMNPSFDKMSDEDILLMAARQS